MTPAEKKLAVHLLKLASDEFSNHGCNDLDLVRDVGLTPEESLQVRRAMHARNGDVRDELPRPDNHWAMDWAAMDFVAAKVGETL